VLALVVMNFKGASAASFRAECDVWLAGVMGVEIVCTSHVEMIVLCVFFCFFLCWGRLRC
jgi:hypothetical protein